MGRSEISLPQFIFFVLQIPTEKIFGVKQSDWLREEKEK